MLLVLAGMLLAVVLLSLRLRSDDETLRLNARLLRTQSARSTLDSVEKQADEIQGKIGSLRQQLEVMQTDYQEVNSRRVSWSQVYKAMIDAAPADMGFSTIQQKNYQIILQGTGSSYASVTNFADRLNGSGLFSSVTIQNINEAPPGSGVPPIGSGPPPAITPVPAPPATAQPTGPATGSPGPPPPTPVVTVLPPTGGTSVAGSPTPIATPAYDFRVSDKTRTSYPGSADRPSVIRGKIVDEQGNLVRGQTVRITTCCPEFKVDVPAPDGSFETTVEKKAIYAAVVINTRSEVANELSTSFPGFTGYHLWEVVFRRAPASGSSPRTGLIVLSDPESGSAPVPLGRPSTATFNFTLVVVVKPGAGQVPAAPPPGFTPPPVGTPPVPTTPSSGAIASPAPPIVSLSPTVAPSTAPGGGTRPSAPSQPGYPAPGGRR